MADIRGKTVVITGASSGVGAAAARQLHALGAHVVPVGRSDRKTAAVADELGVRGYTVDFASLADVRRLATELTDDLPHVDVLAANAGVILLGRTRTDDGIDTMLQVNAIGPWLLTRLLTPLLAGGRIVATSSAAQTRSTLPMDHLDDMVAGRDTSDRTATYPETKLAAAVLLRELGRRHPEITVVDFHPGVIATDLFRTIGPVAKLIKPFAKLVMDTPKNAGSRLVHVATIDGDISGTYYERNRPAAGSPFLSDRTLASRLWDIADRLAPP